MKNLNKLSIGFCKKKNIRKIITFKKKPKKEINLNIKKYFRVYQKCKICGHFYSDHNIELKNLYKKNYLKNTYNDLSGLEKNFKRITNLKKKYSDNYHRVARIIRFINKKKVRNICDVGSGLGVFPSLLRKKINCHYSLIETNPINIKFLKNNLKFNDVFLPNKKNFDDKKFDLITFNKVLEHIQNPYLFLRKYLKFLKNDGFIYLEVPDVFAINDSKFREEFFIEHHHVFSKVSLSKFLNFLSLKIIKLHNIKEPSGKYTLYAFVKKI